ncbi:MAG: mechanosensitive ion channel [Flavobacteriaceae bacterium]|nr:mechanosensitive ion channel [Flavobacteriaceae bacterium]
MLQVEEIQETASEANIWLEKGLELIVDYGPKVIGAILIWIIGSWVIRRILKVASKIMDKRNYDETLKGFLNNLLGGILRVLVILSILGTLGVETTSFAAILAAAGLAIGMALQGSLSNFAGGVMLMIFKPFKIGDLIEGQGELGVVKEIQIFTTHLLTPENKLAIIPNGTLSNGNIINYSTEDMLRIDLTIGIGYGENIKQAKDLIMETLLNDPKILKNPAPTVAVGELADSSVNLVVRPYATVADYWDVYFNSLENIKNALDTAGIEIPYPHSVEIQKKG